MVLKTSRPLAAPLRSVLSPCASDFLGLLDFLSAWNQIWRQLPAAELWPSLIYSIYEKLAVNPFNIM